jgi:histidyl-tRNA synthetase
VAKLDNGPPRGTRDLFPDAVAKREAVIARVAESYARFGFHRIETPALEDITRLSWGEGGDNEKLIYRVMRRGLDPLLADGTNTADLADLGLRYDLTVPLTRFYANNEGRLPSPFRAMQIGPVWRAERPQKGRYRQFTQCDIDTIGEPSALAEAELLEGTVAALAGIGVAPVRIRLNDRRLLTALAAEAGVPAAATGAFLVILDKLDKIGWEKVKAELVERGFDPQVGERSEWTVGLLSAAGEPESALHRAADLLPRLEDDVLEGLSSTAQSLERIQHDVARSRGDGTAPAAFTWILDPTIVRGMGYYTGQIFEVEHAEVTGSVAGGGRYDGLVGRSLGKQVPACGISIGFDRIVDLAVVPSPDLGLALLYSAGAAPAPEILAAARSLRGGERAVALVPRRGQMRVQLDSLKEEGYSSFVTLEDGLLGEERSLR